MSLFGPSRCARCGRTLDEHRVFGSCPDQDDVDGLGPLLIVGLVILLAFAVLQFAGLK